MREIEGHGGRLRGIEGDLRGGSPLGRIWPNSRLFPKLTREKDGTSAEQIAGREGQKGGKGRR